MSSNSYVRQKAVGLWEVTDNEGVFGIMNSYPCAVSMAKDLVRNDKGCVLIFNIDGSEKVEYDYKDPNPDKEEY